MRATAEEQALREIVPRTVVTDIRALKELSEASWSELGMAIDGPEAMASNGRLASSQLSSIPGGRLRDDAARAWNDMRSYIGNHYGVWIKPTGSRSSYRTYSAQVYFWNLYQSGRGNVAAYPGTSNHGWGLAVDVPSTTMAYYIRKHGPHFGWSWDEGRRAGEWWHFRYVGGYRPRSRRRDKLSYLIKRERRLVRELEDLRARAAGDRRGDGYPAGWVVNGDRYRLERAREIKLWIRRQRQRIRDAADKSGWDRTNRRERYHILIDAYNNDL